jgi:hypothetical protein
MKMSTKMVKTGSVGLDTLRDDFSQEENCDALAHIRAEPAYCPLNGMVAASFAGQAKQILDRGFTELTHLRRGQAHKLIETLVRGASWDKSIVAICNELGVSREIIYDIEKKWPYMYHFINLLILELIIPISFGRVLHSTADAAVHGSDRDRRLYFELFGGLRQKNEGRGGTNIVFIQDTMTRPEVIEAERVDEPSDS